MLMELYRLARNQGNLKHAHNLIQRQIMEMTGETENAIEIFNSSTDVSLVEKLRVMRELCKLYTSKGQMAAAIDLLTNSVANYCQQQQGTRTTGPLGSGSELAARSLLVMVKWIQSDTRLLQVVWNTEYDIAQRMSFLLGAEYECRQAHLGLYKDAASHESHELFQPDESVARFDKHEYAIGQLLHLSTMYCPDLAKSWWSLAGWCYRIGRKNLEALR
jgi:PI-3-kinase-related kinase SMG-1